MADPDRKMTTDLLEDTDAHTGVPTVCLVGRVTARTGPKWCVAIPGAANTTTDRNAHTNADTRRTVQSATLANNRTAAEVQEGELDSLRSLWNNARAEFKAILADVQRMPTPFPAVYELENSLESLLREQAYLKKLDSAIIDLVKEELEIEVERAELYIDGFFRA